jgi:dolichol-phosphate mannosyltransferase
VDLSVVIPVCNERENVLPLAREVGAALAQLASREILFVDDGSDDGTAEAVRAAALEIPGIRLVRHSVRCGQSRALHTGIVLARAEWVATLDGDGQNDPADLQTLLRARDRALAAEPRTLLVMGNRVTRRDTWVRRLSSRIANGVRRRLLHDGTPDTGCGLKLLHRRTFVELPAFNHMHRFLPALYQRAGATVISVPVSHRHRTRGLSKYGISNRLWVGIIDLFGVRWLIARGLGRPEITEA